MNYGLYTSATASNSFFACVPSYQPKSLLFKPKRVWAISRCDPRRDRLSQARSSNDSGHCDATSARPLSAKGGSDAKAVLDRSRTVTTIRIASVDVSRGLRRTASGSHPDPERGILALRAHTPRPDTKLRVVAHREAIQHRLVHSEWARCGRRSSE